MIEKVTAAEETAMLVKYGTKGYAILCWWGVTPKPEEEWELWVCKKWRQEKWREGKGDKYKYENILSLVKCLND